MVKMTLRSALFTALLAAPLASAQLSVYQQDFEALDQSDPAALAGDGWLVFANVFNAAGDTLIYNYGPFVAPNGSGAFSNVAAGEGGPEQGDQQIVTFSDYNNADHNVGRRIEANVFQEFTIAAGDSGDWTFSFDAKRGDAGGASTSLAFIRTLDPANGFALTNEVTIDTTNLPETWGRFSISLVVTPELTGQLLQIGFATVAANFEPSGVFYDNILFALPATDTDGDGINDDVDNCTEVANPDQRDTDADGFGNICDADLNNDLNVNFADLGLLRVVFFTNDQNADFNGDGTVNFSDLGILRAGFLSPPGPAAGQ